MLVENRPSSIFGSERTVSHAERFAIKKCVSKCQLERQTTVGQHSLAPKGDLPHCQQSAPVRPVCVQRRSVHLYIRVSRSRLLCIRALSLSRAAAPPSFITIIIEPLLPASACLAGCVHVGAFALVADGRGRCQRSRSATAAAAHEYLCANVYFFALSRATWTSSIHSKRECATAAAAGWMKGEMILFSEERFVLALLCRCVLVISLEFQASASRVELLALNFSSGIHTSTHAFVA